MIGARDRSMTRIGALVVCLIAILIALVGCAPTVDDAVLYGFAPQPPDYSPNYTYVPIIDPNRPCCVQRWVLMPEACLAPDPTEPQLFGPHVPPACANNYNLMRMATRKRDLLEGRRLGAAPAAPSVRAAQKYLYGGSGPLGGGLPGPVSAAAASGESDKEKPASSDQSPPGATTIRPDGKSPDTVNHQ
jgi:hypothetical protein